jgi:hypothetical protein
MSRDVISFQTMSWGDRGVLQNRKQNYSTITEFEKYYFVLPLGPVQSPYENLFRYLSQSKNL